MINIIDVHNYRWESKERKMRWMRVALPSELQAVMVQLQMLRGLSNPGCDPAAVLLACIETLNGNYLGQKKWLQVIFITCCSEWFQWIILCFNLIFNGHDIYNTRPFRSLSMKVWLHSAHMFIYIISGLSAAEVFISNKPCGVWFLLSAHAPMKLDFSCSTIRTSFCLC